MELQASKSIAKDPQGAQAVGELQEICLQPGTEKVVRVGKALCEAEKSKLVRFLQEHQDCFTWLPNDMPRIPTRFTQHSLTIDRTAKPVKQKR